MISVIVPVYNAERYINRCVESILKQSYCDFELILIDDGSTDSSLELCRAFSEKDSRIRVIHQKNQGVSSARNCGIRNACGEYIGFVDIDDYIHEDMLKEMLFQLRNTNSEIAVCDSLAISSNGDSLAETLYMFDENSILEKKTISPSVLLEMAGAVWRCIYSTELIKNNNILFPLGLKISEDRIFNLYAMGCAKRIAYLKKTLYYRTLNEDSTVHRYHSNYMKIVEKGRSETIRAIRNAWNNDMEIQDIYKKQYVEACIKAIENAKHKDARKLFIQRYMEVRTIAKKSELIDAIKSTGYYKNDYICKWILKGNYIILSLRKQKYFRRIESIKKQIAEIGLQSYFRELLIRKVGK